MRVQPSPSRRWALPAAEPAANLGDAMSRRRAATPTPAEIWRILRGIARDERIARRRDRALARRFRRERGARERAAAALEQRLREEQAERDRKLEEKLNRIAGDGDARWGQLMEALVGGDLVKLLRDAGVDVEVLGRRISSQNREGVWREYDLVAAGKSVVVVVEVKTTLREADVKRFVSRLGGFPEGRGGGAAAPRVVAAGLRAAPDVRGARVPHGEGQRGAGGGGGGLLPHPGGGFERQHRELRGLRAPSLLNTRAGPDQAAAKRPTSVSPARLATRYRAGNVARHACRIPYAGERPDGRGAGRSGHRNGPGRLRPEFRDELKEVLTRRIP